MKRSPWIAPALWGVFIEVLTSWPRPPDVGAPAGSDKAVHILLYGVFAVLSIRAAEAGRPGIRAIVGVMLALSAWGALDELHQKLIPGREASIADWLADNGGVALGLAAALVKPRSAGSARS